MHQLSYQTSWATRINNRGLGKPNEDFVLADNTLGFFMVLDGITRVHKEYELRPGQSAACEITQLFADAAQHYIAANPELSPEMLLRGAALAGNAAIVPYRRQRPLADWQFYPGTLGILGLIREERFYCVYTGDCLGILIRDDQKTAFGCQEQTRTLEKQKISKKDRYDIYCNHPEHPLGYGIFNGDEALSRLLSETSMALLPGDTLLLCTDGVGDYMRSAPAAVLREQSPEEMIDASAPYDQPPYATYADDKTILKVQIV